MNHRALIAESSPIVAQRTAAQLRQLGVTTTILRDASEVLRETRAQVFDLIVLDFELSGLQADELTRQLREEEAARGTHRSKIVATCFDPDEALRARCRDAGMNAVLAHPIGPQQLRALVPHEARLSDLDEKTFESVRKMGIASGDPALLPDLLASFHQSGAQHLQAIVDSAERGNWHDVGRAAHALKGGALALGALRVAASCGDIERAARHERLGDVEDLRRSYERACAALDRAINAPQRAG